MPSSRNSDHVVLQQWLQACLTTYSLVVDDPESGEVAPRLYSLQNALNGGPQHEDTTERIRQLLAIGAFHFQFGNARPSSTIVPRAIAIGLATEMLWALVISDLPEDWVRGVFEIADLPIAAVIADVRGNNKDKLDLTRAISVSDCADGLRRAFEDLCDPARGGAYIIAMGRSYQRVSQTPIEWLIPKKARWFGVAALAGVVGNRADDLTTWLFEALKDAAEPIDLRRLYEPGKGGPAASQSSGPLQEPEDRRPGQDDAMRPPPARAAAPSPNIGASEGASSYSSDYVYTAERQRPAAAANAAAGVSGISDGGQVQGAGDYLTSSNRDPSSSGVMMDFFWVISHDVIHFFQSVIVLLS